MINKFQNFVNESRTKNWWEKHIDEIKDVFIEYQDEGLLGSIEVGFYNTINDAYCMFDIKSLKLKDQDTSTQIELINIGLNKGNLLAFGVNLKIPIMEKKGLWSNEISLQTLKQWDFIKDSTRLENDWDIRFNLNSNSETYKPVRILFIQKWK